MELSCKISEDVSDASIASWPAPMGQEVLIVKNRKKRNTIAKIYPLTAVSGDRGLSLPEPMEWSRSAPFASIGSIRGLEKAKR
jgi:hypothetical protein